MNRKEKDKKNFERLFHGDYRTMEMLHSSVDHMVPAMKDLIEQREHKEEEWYRDQDRRLTCSAGKKKVGLKDINIWRLSTDVYLWYLRMKRWLGYTPHVIDVKRLTSRWGFTDEAINSAIDVVADKGGTVFLPPAPNPTYDVTSEIKIKDKIALTGPPHAPHSRIVKLLKGANINVIENNDQTGSGNYWAYLGHLFIDGDKGSYTGKGIEWDNPSALTNPILTLNEVAVINCQSDGIYIDTHQQVFHMYKVWSLDHSGRGVYMNASDSVIFKLNTASVTGTELELDEDCMLNNVMGCYIGGSASGSGDNGKCVLKAAYMNKLTSNTFDYGTKNGVVLKDVGSEFCSMNVFSGGTIERMGISASNTYDGISIEGNSDDNVFCGLYIGKKKYQSASMKYAVDEGASCDYNLFVGLNVRNVLNATKINRQGANSKIRGCIGQADAG